MDGVGGGEGGVSVYALVDDRERFDLRMTNQITLTCPSNKAIVSVPSALSMTEEAYIEGCLIIQ